MMAHLQEAQKKRYRPRSLALLLLIVLLMIGGAILWILNIQGAVTGSWSSSLSVVFTVFGSIVAFLQWHQQSPAEKPQDPSLPVSTVQLEATSLGVNRRKGALIVKVKKKFVGSTVDLCQGFDTPVVRAERAAGVVFRRVDDAPTYVALFPALEPGNYTVALHSTEHRTNVTIQAGRVAEIDWRLKHGRISRFEKGR